METFFRTPYNFDGLAWSDQTGLSCKDKSLAQQQFKDQCDINILFGKYLETGEMPQLETVLNYGNFEGIYDFQSAMNLVVDAQHQFSQLPARIKNRFDNNPQRLLEFLNDPENREEAEFLKLVQPRPTPEAPAPTLATGSTSSTQPATTTTPPVSNPSGGKPQT